MKKRFIAHILLLALVLALALPAASGVAEAKAASVKLTLGVRQTYQIDASSIPGASGQTLLFKSKNKKIATVSATGLVRAKKKGKTQIAVGYGKTVLAVCSVTVMAEPKSVKLSDKSVYLYEGGTKQLSVKLPKKTYSPVEFKSDDEQVATVDSTGKLTGVKAGETTVTATLYNGRSARCAVRVLAGGEPTALETNVPALSLQIGEKFQLVASTGAENNAVFSFASKNKKIAKVDKNGVVKGVKKGKTTIRVKTQNGLAKNVPVVVTKKLKLTEVYGALTNSTETFLENAAKLKLTKDDDPTSQMVMYHNTQLALIMEEKACRVALNPATTPKYSIEKIHVNMSPEQAAVNLVNQGWTAANTRTSDGTTTVTFIKGTDTTHTVSIATNDGTSILGIEAALTW